MKKGFVLTLFALLAISMAASLAACAPRGGSFAVQEAWARPASAGGNSAVYFVIDNPLAEADTLLGAQCEAAMMTEVHMTETDASGKSMMKHQESVGVPSGQKVEFKPGGLHVMLMNLKNDLEPGQTLPVTLQFANAGEVQITATVREP
jgi:periplasmic copper chaperone A